MDVITRWAVVGLLAVIGLTGCAGVEAPVADDTVETVEAVTDDAAEGVADDAAGADAAGDGAAPAGEEASDEQAAPEGGAGIATVQVDGETFTFRVIQCLRDATGSMGGTVVFQLDGVPPDTAPELVDPLLGPVDPDADIRERLEPVLDGGPILSISRVTDGGDMVAVSTSLDSAYVTTPDVTSVEARWLDISDAPPGTTVVGRAKVTTPQGNSAQLSVDAVCP